MAGVYGGYWVITKIPDCLAYPRLFKGNNKDAVRKFANNFVSPLLFSQPDYPKIHSKVGSCTRVLEQGLLLTFATRHQFSACAGAYTFGDSPFAKMVLPSAGKKLSIGCDYLISSELAAKSTLHEIYVAQTRYKDIQANSPKEISDAVFSDSFRFDQGCLGYECELVDRFAIGCPIYADISGENGIEKCSVISSEVEKISVTSSGLYEAKIAENDIDGFSGGGLFATIKIYGGLKLALLGVVSNGGNGVLYAEDVNTFISGVADSNYFENSSFGQRIRDVRIKKSTVSPD
ncbi:hypothetical protein [Tateyamaria sp.]|uniref:hypothetical protein n=1 Tax=Tateyamaria sp. TaxID=1929288 RepID=UPI00329C7BAC